jgi:hypothetical protein
MRRVSCHCHPIHAHAGDGCLDNVGARESIADADGYAYAARQADRQEHGRVGDAHRASAGARAQAPRGDAGAHGAR